MDVTLIPLVLAVVVPAFFGLVIGIILLVGRARPQPGLGVHPTAGPPQVGPPASPGPPAGVWNGEVLGDGALGALGGTLSSTFGTFHVERGMVGFMPDGAPTPLWWVPGPQVTARKRGVLSLDGADVELWGPMGHVRCNVSRERINRLSRNDFKHLRERSYADELLWTLHANGARVQG